MTNGFLVSVPHERLHGTISILKQRPEHECVQSAGSQRRNAAHHLSHVYRTTCTGATAGGSLALQACLAQQAGNRSPSETASMTSTWKEAWESENMAQNAIGLDGDPDCTYAIQGPQSAFIIFSNSALWPVLIQ